MAINPAVCANVPFDPLRSFAPIVQTVRAAQVLAVRPDLPAATLAEFVALTTSRPVSLGTPGNGSIGHLVAELIRVRTGAGFTHVPFHGGGLASTKLLAGNIDALSLTLTAVVRPLRDGRMRANAVSTAARSAVLPEVSTVAKAGLPGYDVVSWQGLLTPAGTDPTILARLNREANRALALPEVDQQLRDQALEPVGSGAEVLAALLRADVARWPAVVRAAGIQLD